MLRKSILAATAVAAGLMAIPAEAKEFKYAFQSDAVSLDPQSTRLIFTTAFIGNVMEPLVRFNKETQPEPSLATSWERVSDTVWRFNLRKGVKYHNGNDFNADDVTFTFERARHEKSPFQGMVSGMSSVKKIDDYTIEIDTGTPNPTLLRSLPAILILDKEWTTEHNATVPATPGDETGSYLTSHINGTGPFILASYQPGVKAVFDANPNWWDDANKEHNLTRAVFQPIKSDATRVAALLSGELDMIYPMPLQDIKRVESSNAYKVIVAPSVRTVMLGLDLKNDELVGSNVKGKNPFKDLRVRKAVYAAIDIEAIKKKIMRGLSVPAPAIVAPGINGHDDSLNGRLMSYDPAAAKELLAEAGYPDGFSFQLDCPNDRYINDEEICLALSAMLAKVGLDVTVNAQTKSKHFKDMLTGNSNMFMVAWGADLALDASSYLRDLMHTPDGKKMGTWNPGGYSNARVDEIQALAAKEMDADKRRALMAEAFGLHKQEIGHIPLHTQVLVWAAKKNVDVYPTPYDVLWLRWVKVN